MHVWNVLSDITLKKCSLLLQVVNDQLLSRGITRGNRDICLSHEEWDVLKKNLERLKNSNTSKSPPFTRCLLYTLNDNRTLVFQMNTSVHNTLFISLFINPSRNSVLPMAQNVYKYSSPALGNGATIDYLVIGNGDQWSTKISLR